MNPRAQRTGRRAAMAAALGATALVLGGAATLPEAALAVAAGVLAAVYVARVARRARARFRPPLRWTRAVARAIPALFVESVLLARALARQVAGGAAVEGRDDEGPITTAHVDAATTAIAAAVYPCLTPNTVVRTVRRDGRVDGRRLVDAPGHAIRDDLARLA